VGGQKVLETPRKFTLLAGTAEGPTRLNAFDNALLAAGIGNLNLVRVSSILPPGCVETASLAIPEGALTPTAYGTITSEEQGRKIAAGVGVGIGADNRYGVIMEFSGYGTRENAAAMVDKMVREAFQARDRELARVVVKAVEHDVVAIGCAFAAVALWY